MYTFSTLLLFIKNTALQAGMIKAEHDWLTAINDGVGDYPRLLFFVDDFGGLEDEDSYSRYRVKMSLFMQKTDGEGGEAGPEHMREIWEQIRLHYERIFRDLDVLSDSKIALVRRPKYKPDEGTIGNDLCVWLTADVDFRVFSCPDSLPGPIPEPLPQPEPGDNYITATQAEALIDDAIGDLDFVEGVSGDGVDNTDPKNPVIKASQLQKVGEQGSTMEVKTNIFLKVTDNEGVTKGEFLITPFGAVYFKGADNVLIEGTNLVDIQSNLIRLLGNVQLGGSLTYNSDQSGAYNNRSVPDVEWVNSKILAEQTAGTALTFTRDRVYGTLAAPETGNITLNNAGANIGVTVMVIHNNANAPEFTNSFKKLTGSGDYVPGVLNYIFCLYMGTEVLYSITQKQ